MSDALRARLFLVCPTPDGFSTVPYSHSSRPSSLSRQLSAPGDTPTNLLFMRLRVSLIDLNIEYMLSRVGGWITMLLNLA